MFISIRMYALQMCIVPALAANTNKCPRQWHVLYNSESNTLIDKPNEDAI